MLFGTGRGLFMIAAPAVALLPSFAPHLALAPGIAIIVTVLGINTLGDGLNDYLDPKLRRNLQ